MSTELFHCWEHIVSAQHIRQYYQATAESPEQELKLSVKEYTPRDKSTARPGDATIIACHGAGFFKELYEPLFDELLLATRRQKGDFRIGSIWIADMVSHGQSGTLNEGKLGLDINYDDHARDLLHIVNVFRSRMHRPLVGIGHSMGAGQILTLAYLHPTLFSSVVCIEPVITRGFDFMHLGAVNIFTFRKDIWPSREDAVAAARKNVLFKGWDERVLELFFKYGFRELPTLLYPETSKALTDFKIGMKPVTLTTTKHHEARTYGRPAFPERDQPLSSWQADRSTHPDLLKTEHEKLNQPIYRPEPVTAHRNLPALRPSCNFIYGAKSPFVSNQPEGRAIKMQITGTGPGGSGGAAAGKVKEAVLSVGGHYVPLEHPKAVAEQLTSMLGESLMTWAKEEEDQKARWAKLDTRDKAMMDDEWIWWIGNYYGKQKKKSGPSKRSRL
ncbi:hypothetical protein PRZ48_006883 [Zasmidium cellare]|uniref:AB hydrolase-1 domain-containing protein n=1 Tax=Zasmidium cellare TaxID=395010 RepID=A0ABR0EHU1_ZASCE|nr:hypothetical protein PRZ48_006883 [Zasmidium cellare]